MKMRITPRLAVILVCALVSLVAGCRTTPQSGIVGKWRSADGSYVVEFRAAGTCSAGFQLHGRVVGGPCTYTVGKDDIVLHYKGSALDSKSGASENSATWHYSLAGDVLNVTVFGNSVALQRTP